MENSNLWIQLIESSPAEIHLQARDKSLPPRILTYAEIVSAYLQGDTEKLARRVGNLSSQDLPLFELGHLRLKIRQSELTVREVHRLSELPLEGIFAAELWFCLGLAWEALGNDQMAMQSFSQSQIHYQIASCPKKSLRALYNSVAAESRVAPHKNFIADYQAIIERARGLGEKSFEGMALTMLSREYQVVGMLPKALELAHEASLCLESERGTIHYFHNLLHKAHVLLDLEKIEEAKPLIDECKLAPFPAIQAARALISLRMDPSLIWDPQLEKDLLPTWRNRIPAFTNGRRAVIHQKKTSPLEDQLLRLAYNGPIDKWDLIAKLYPEEADSLAKENRFKNLVARIRTKFPDLLSCNQGKYSVPHLPVPQLEGNHS